jgi:hypothetical protein
MAIFPIRSIPDSSTVRAPSKVLITPLGQPSGNLWVSNITSTSFTINISSAPSANLSVAWLAEC